MGVKSVSRSGSTRTSSSNRIEFGFFLALNVILVPFSAWMTYRGYLNGVFDNTTIGQVQAGAITLATAIFFLAMNFGIRRRRLSGVSHSWQVLFYILPLGFSFVGAFHTFYHQQTKQDRLVKERGLYINTFEKTYSDSRSQLLKSTGISEIKKEVDQRLSDLSIAYSTDGGEGWGKASKSKWQDLRVYFEEVSPPGFPTLYTMVNQKMTYSDASEIVSRHMRNLEGALSSETTPVVQKVDSVYTITKNQLRKSDSLRAWTDVGRGVVLLNSVREANNYICHETTALINISCTLIEAPQSSTMDRLQSTLESAFIQQEHVVTTLSSLVLSLLIDLGSLAYVLLFVPFKKTKSRVGGPKHI